MRRAVIVGIITALLGVALVQDSQGGGASLEISTEPANALVNVTGPEGLMSVLDLSGGSETLTGLPQGLYFIVATAEGHAVSQTEIELGEGAQESVSLQLQPLQGGGQAAQEQAQDGQQQDGQQAQQQQGQQEDVAGGGQAQAQGGQQGEQTFQQQCAQCHGQEGGGGSGPALAGNQNLQNHEMVIGQILNGGGGMPPFANQLSDEQVASVATHELNSWGNDFGQISADQVSQVRGGGQAQGGQQQAQQQDQQGQQGQQGQQQPTVQVEQGGQQARIEITLPATGEPVSLNLQLEIGTGAGPAARGAQGATGSQQQTGQQQAGQQQRQQPGQQQAGQQQPGQQQEGQQPGQQQAGQQQQPGQQQTGQQQTDQQQGWYGQVQAQSGAEAYLGQCAACHGGAMEGRPPYPPTVGNEFLGNWSGKTLRDLFDYISSQMPDDRPGELDEQTYAEVTAYILQQNGFPAGRRLDPRSNRLDQLMIRGANQQQAQQQGQQQPQQQGQQQQQPGQQDVGQSQQQQRPGQQQAGQQQAGQQQQQPGQQQQQQETQDQVAGAGQQGQQVYRQQCAQCHGQQGEGGAGPALAGDQNLQDVQLVVTQILQGGGGMPAFGAQLSDEQVAAVATHEMSSWGNAFGQVTPGQVAQVRGGGQAQQQQRPGEASPQGQPAQQQSQGQQGQQATQGQSQQQDAQGQAQDQLQGTLQIDWIEPAGATVTVTGPEGFSRETSVTGGELFTGLTPGTYTVTASSPGFDSSTQEVEVEAQRTATVTLDLRQ